MMTAIPWDLFSEMCDPKANTNRDGSASCAVGMVFLPKPKDAYDDALQAVEKVIKRSGLEIAGWRDVPVNPTILGTLSAEFVPLIKQVVFKAPAGKAYATEAEFEKVLYDLRREIQGTFRVQGQTNAYICSFSSKTIVYKGMLRACDLGLFYRDLKDPMYKTPFAIYHRRFSTNTVPKWFLAQPFRMLAHNGEINTLLGNINWVKSRYGIEDKNAPTLQDKRDMDLIRGPLVDVGRSDSANLDSILDSFVKAGKTPQEALMILVPEAFDSQPKLKDSPNVKAFYEYYESMQEAWDGPALLVFSDGNSVGAALDRNGLRPARFMLTQNAQGKETVHVMSEVGVTKILNQFNTVGAAPTGQKLVQSGRLGPGEMLSVNLKEGKLYLNDELKRSVASARPYVDWASKAIVKLPRSSFKGDVAAFADRYVKDATVKAAALVLTEKDYQPVAEEEQRDDQSLVELQTFFGWGTEDVEVQISAMAGDAVEATISMGDDAPLAALSAFSHTLYDYFKQRFAQVTNPPIDPLREGAVMSLSMFLGPRGDPLLPNGQSDKRVKIESPVLNMDELKALSTQPGVKLTTVSTLYEIADSVTVGGLEGQIQRLCDEAVAAVKAGATIINLSDMLPTQVNAPATAGYLGKTYIPPLLAVGAVHHRLIESGLRTKASVMVTTGQAWSTHHFACLVGYGASAVVPYAAYDAVVNWHSLKRNQLAMERGDIPKISAAKAMTNYRKAIDKGLLKILSKMGISLLSSYHGAQIFEALGVADNVINTAFKGTPCRVSGMSFDDIAAENTDFARRAFGDEQFNGIAQKIESEDEEASEHKKKLFNYGFLNFFKSGEFHHNNQPLIKTLHSAIRSKDLNLYNLYEQSVRSRPPTTLRDALEFAPSKRQPIPLDQVESAESIMKRFCSGGMSLGALGREAHETMAIALNRIGGRSNSGEGGEDPARFNPIMDVTPEGTSASFPHLKGLKNGDRATSRIKQVASGRFGVTPEYLMAAEQLEIKIAQGAKPGEGGQLPGPKIDAYIARLRASKPGVTLISPPPHHDIYSIEDLAQLIYDLHQINPAAGVSVKLVAEVGIGTVASGVTKAGADIIQISGHDGGTGASPASSIKHAGSPWELGLSEVHNVLRKNDLRERVVLRVDGGLKSGWDVVMAAAMGAEEFGFGTIAMIAEGCIMARICHTNKCPVGIATQNEALRKRFPGQPDNIVTFFGFVAEEVRHILAELGYSSVDEIIGRPGVLQARSDLKLKKTSNLDLSYVLQSMMCIPAEGENFCPPAFDRSWLKKGPYTDNGKTFCDIILTDPEVAAVVERGAGSVRKEYRITNVDRAAFTRVSGALAKKYGNKGFQGRLSFDLTGAAGQSFCAFLTQGMDIKLIGYANDYVAKGMNGGKVVVTPPKEDDEACRAAGRGSDASKHSVVGNTVLYGATGGVLHVRGRGGERFAVRNSGATGVVEGLGDHGCEYMTGGSIVCLGNTGRNFGAGMTGGLAFVIDDEAWLDGASAPAAASGRAPTPTMGGMFNSLFNAKDTPSTAAPLSFVDFVNPETITLQQLTAGHVNAKKYLTDLLQAHVTETGSARAAHMLANMDEAIKRVWMVVPAAEKTNPLVVTADAASKVVEVGASA